MIRAVTLALAGALLAAPAASATFPGENGGFAVSLSGCQENRFIRLLSLYGAPQRDLTPRCEEVGEDVHRDTSAPDWFPDGSRLAYVDDPFDAPSRVATLAVEGPDLPPVVSRPSYGDEHAPSVSPRGDRIAYERDGAILTSALDGGDERLVHGDRPFYARPRWSPDGRRFLVERLRPASLWVIDARTGRAVRRLARGGYEPDWSPDGRWVVFRTRFVQDEIRGGASGGNLYIVRADGSGRPRRIVHRKRVAETSPVWSPDGRFVAWVSLRFSAGDVGFRVYPSLWRTKVFDGFGATRLRTLPRPFVEEGFYDPPEIAWRPLPG